MEIAENYRRRTAAGWEAIVIVTSRQIQVTGAIDRHSPGAEYVRNGDRGLIAGRRYFVDRRRIVVIQILRIRDEHIASRIHGDGLRIIGEPRHRDRTGNRRGVLRGYRELRPDSRPVKHELYQDVACIVDNLHRPGPHPGCQRREFDSDRTRLTFCRGECD